MVDVDNTISVQPSFLEGSSNGRGNFNFLLQTYSDPEFSIEQSNGFKTGEVMYFDVTIDRVVTGVQFSGTLKTIRSKNTYFKNPLAIFLNWQKFRYCGQKKILKNRNSRNSRK